MGLLGEPARQATAAGSRVTANDRRASPGLRGMALSALLLVLHACAQTDAPARVPAGRSIDLEGFAPPGWTVEQRHTADLNGDGRHDALLLLAPVRNLPPDISGGARLSPPRILAVVMGVPGGYVLSASNAKLVPQVDSTSQEDPLADGEIDVRSGGFGLKLTLMSGVGSYLSASVRYRFADRDGCFRLIGYDRLETHRATLDTRDLSIDFLSGDVVLTEGNAQSGASTVRRERLTSNPRRCFQDLGSAAEFDPL